MKVNQLLEDTQQKYLDWDTAFDGRSANALAKGRAIFDVTRSHYFVKDETIRDFKCEHPLGMPRNLLIQECHIESFDAISEMPINRLIIENCTFGPNGFEHFVHPELEELKIFGHVDIPTSFIGMSLPKLRKFWSNLPMQSLAGINTAFKSCEYVRLFIRSDVTRILGLCMLFDFLDSAKPGTMGYFRFLNSNGDLCNAANTANYDLYHVIDEYVGQGRDSMLDFQTALIDAGYPAAAKL